MTTERHTKLKRGFSPAVQVRCVVCGHKETVALTREMPACTQCLGPVVAEKVEVRRGR